MNHENKLTGKLRLGNLKVVKPLESLERELFGELVESIQNPENVLLGKEYSLVKTPKCLFLVQNKQEGDRRVVGYKKTINPDDYFGYGRVFLGVDSKEGDIRFYYLTFGDCCYDTNLLSVDPKTGRMFHACVDFNQ